MLQNRVTLVTGAGRGIGRAVSLALGEQGARVAVTSRSRDQLEKLVGEITAVGGEAIAIVDDLTDRAAPSRIVDQVIERWGPVEILVNNAGVGSSQDPRPLVDYNDDFWDLTMLVNVTVPYRLTKTVLPAMIEKGWGRVINVASIAGKVPAFHGAAYSTSKHAVIGLTKVTAAEVAAHGVTANAICPGVTRSLMNDKRIEYDAERLGVTFEHLEQTATPLGRRLEPEEIATLAVYLASDGAAAVNGQSINVCGGTVVV
jgi:NAD(P)-dependent dehydrogenase (short-subunit alcohol dehydrogenase family)